MPCHSEWQGERKTSSARLRARRHKQRGDRALEIITDTLERGTSRLMEICNELHALNMLGMPHMMQ